MPDAENRLIPPHNDEAEKAVLSALLQHQDAYDRIGSIISASDFYHPAHRVIYSVITDMNILHTEAVDSITLTKKLYDKDLIDKAGGPSYISSLSSQHSVYANIEKYAEMIKEAALRRAMIDTGSNVVQHAYDPSQDVFEVLEGAEKSFSEISVNTNVNTSEAYAIAPMVQNVLSLLADKVEGKYVPDTVETNYSLLDKYTNGGLKNSDYIIIAARPSVGKTALAVSMMRNMLMHDKKVAFFSLEMDANAIISRMLSSISRVDLANIMKGNVDTEEMEKVANAAEKIWNKDFFIVDVPNMKLGDIRSRARLLKREKDIDIIFIDYIGIIDSGLPSTVPRHEQVGYVSKALKQIARELKIPVVVLCQVSRDTADQEPQLNNLRDSGSIEQDADVVMFIHRRTNLSELTDEEKAKLQTDETGRARVQSSKLLVAKNRNGKTGTIFLGYIGDLTSFEEISQDKHLFIESKHDDLTKRR